MPFASRVQCRLCFSDYMVAAVDGICQRCQQRKEFLVRELPQEQVEQLTSSPGSGRSVDTKSGKEVAAWG